MAERSVVVRLRADVTSYQRGLGQASAATADLDKKLARSTKQREEDFKTLGYASLAAGGAIALGLGKAVGASASFEKQLSGVAAVSGSSAAEMQRLSDAAIKAGASTKLAGVSASDAARAEAELVKAGVSVSDILGGALMGSLSLASAGQLDFGKAAEISAQQMNIFGLSGREVGKVADFLAAAANKSAADVEGLGEALRQGGLVASQVGLSMEETVATLALFADNALLGSDAGTSLKTMLQRLTPQSSEAAGEMERLGFSAFDAQGEFIGMEGLTKELTDSFSGLTTEQRSAAFATIFGSDAVRAASVLFSAGEAKVAEYNLAVLDQGAAARMAATQMDNLSGDIEGLGGVIETALIKGGSQATGVLRTLVQTATDTVSGFSELPDVAQATGMGLSAAAAGGLLAFGTFGSLVGRVRETRAALESMGTAGMALNRNLGKIAGLGGGVLIGVSLLSNALGRAQAEADELLSKLSADIDMSSVDSMRQGLQTFEDQLAQLREESDRFGGAWNPVRYLRSALEVLTPLENSVIDNVEAMKAFGDGAGVTARQLIVTEENLWTAVNTLGLSKAAVENLANTYGIDLSGALDEVQPQLAAASAEHETLRTATRGSADATEELSETQKLLGESIRGMLSPLDAFGQALDDKKAGAQSFAEAQAEATGKSVTEWEGMVSGVKLELGEYAAALEEQNTNVRNWQTNLVTVSQRAGADVALALAQMGQEGVHLTGLMATGTDAEVRRMAGSLRDNAALGGGNMVAELDTAMKIAQAVSRGGAKGTVDAIAEQLNIGVGVVREIAGKYGIALEQGIHPVLIALKGSGWGMTAARNAIRKEDGGFVDFYGMGGLKESHQAQIARAGDWRVWAEPETGGEAYIPLSPAKRNRSLDIWQETGRRLGVEHFAEGGFGNVGQIPLPPTSPHGPPISTRSNESWQSWYGTVKELVEARERMAPQLGPGIGYEAMMAALRARFPGLPLISGFRPGAITATGNPSYHGMGRAVDIPPRMDVNRWIAENYGPQTKELILSLPGARQIRNGRPHTYTGITRAMHFCVPLDVEILTKRGWLTYDQVREGDETPGLNWKTGETEWTPILGVNRYEDAEVVETGSNQWTVRTTPEHKWVARHPQTGEHHWVTTGSRQQHPWVVAAPMADGLGVDLTEDEAELLGWLMTDGSQWEGDTPCDFEDCANTATGKRLCGSHRRQQRKGQELRPLRRGSGTQRPGFSLFVWQVKPQGTKRLKAVLGDKASSNGKGFRLRDAYARDLLARAGLTHIKKADELLVLVATMTGTQRQAMLRGVIGGDGTDNGRRVLQNDGPLVGVITTLAYYCGKRPRVTKRNLSDDGWRRTGVPMAISLSRPRVSTYRQERRPLGQMPVWCPTTALGTWTARFDGNPVLTGNSHNHWAMAQGGIFNPHIRDNGGPLLPGYTFNGSGKPEQVIPAPSASQQSGPTITITSSHSWYVDGELGASSRRQLERMMDDRDQEIVQMVEQVTG